MTGNHNEVHEIDESDAVLVPDVVKKEQTIYSNMVDDINRKRARHDGRI